MSPASLALSTVFRGFGALWHGVGFRASREVSTFCQAGGRGLSTGEGAGSASDSRPRPFLEVGCSLAPREGLLTNKDCET